MRCACAIVCGLAVSAGSALAQTGTLDQVSPVPPGAGSAGFNVGTSFLVWQQQIRAGLAGQLEGVRVTLTGDAGVLTNVRIRVGPGWNTSAAVFDAPVVKQASGTEVIFVNMMAANIQLNVGDLFVMETQGNDTGCGLNGSYIAPPGTPLYSEPLFLTGSVFADGGWRHGFESYVIVEAECYADCNKSGNLTIADFGCFQAAFAAGNLYADCNQSGTLTIADFGCFQAEFAAGCP